MNATRFAVLALVRDGRSGELVVLLAALVVAVAALTGVAFFTDRVAQAVSRQAAEVLAADLRLQSSRPLSREYLAEAHAAGLQTAQTLSFPTVVFFGSDSTLAALRAVDAGYPLRGRVKVADEAFAEARETRAIPAHGEAWLDSRLLARLGARIGDVVEIGAERFRVAQVLAYRPDQGSAFINLAPSVLINLGDMAATQLIQPGSRASYAMLFAGPASAIDAFRSRLLATKQAGERLVDVSEASPQIQSSTERAARFLNLSALVTVMLAAVAVAMAARRYVRRHLDNVALMKCMGASQAFVLKVTVTELLLLAVLAAMLGTLIGHAVQQGLAWLLQEFIRTALPPPGWAPVWLGLVMAVSVLIGFALPPMLQLKRVPPARVLRHDLEPPPLRHAAVYLFAVGALLLLLMVVVRDLRLVAYLAAAAAGTLLALTAAGWLLVWLAGRLRSGVGLAWRYGIANLARRGRESVVQVVAFGLGLMVLLLLGVVRQDLLDSWRRSLPADTPNHFLINIRSDQLDAFRRFFTDRGLPAPTLFPMIRARMTAVNDVPIASLPLQGDRAHAFAEREQNLSWAADLQQDNRIVAGRWWTTADAGRKLVSVTSEYAEELGIGIGDKLSFDVAGEPLQAEVASIRKVQWDTFRPNFFLVFSPGTLDGMVGTWLTALKLDPAGRRSLTELVHEFPGVSIFDIEAILAQVRQVADRASLAVQYVFLFTLLAGVMVLLAAVQSTRDERAYESAMLRTLGASRRVVLAGVASEFIALGVLAGLLAATGASIAGWWLATRLFDLGYQPDPLVWLAGIVLGAVLVGGAGTLAARSVVRQSPLITLRQ